MSLNQFQPARRNAHQAGFSIVEMILVLAILGILCGIGILQFAVLKAGTIDETRYKRNAQELAAVCTEAQVAGLDFVAEDDLSQTIKNISRGGVPTDGVFSGKTFAVPGISGSEVERVAKYLSLRNGMLVYNCSQQL